MITRRQFVQAAVTGTGALSLIGCSLPFMDRNPVTERDVEVARQMGAPDDVMASLEAGRWPSDLVHEKIKNAEACIDYLSDTYGLEFSAVSATGGATWMTHEHDVTLRIESGEHAGEEVHLKYDPGVRNGKQEAEPSFKEDCYYVVNHEEWERIASEAIAPVLAGLPEGAWVMAPEMSRTYYSAVQIDRPITEGGGYGDVDLFVNMSVLSLTSEETYALLDGMQDAMESTGLRGSCVVYGFAGGEAGELIAEGAAPVLADHTFYEFRSFGV